MLVLALVNYGAGRLVGAGMNPLINKSNSRWTSLAVVAAVVLIITFLWLALSPNRAGASYLRVDFDGSRTIDDGTIAFTAAFAPSAVEVGEVTTLNLTLVNRGTAPIAPQITIALPANFSLAVAQLRSGATYNFQTGEISWQPVVTGDGVGELSLPVTASFAPVDQPEQVIPISLNVGPNQHFTNVAIWVGNPPTGSMSINPLRGSVGQPIQLQADIIGSGPIRQVWDLGDGRIVPATNPTVVFPHAGSYVVELQAVNPAGVHRVQEVIVIGPEPAAYFRPEDTSPAVNQPVLFTSQGGGEGPLEYLWNFGDGVSSTEANPTHTFTEPGTYNVVLTIRNRYGQAQNFLPVSVGYPPVADAIIPELTEAGRPLTGQAFTDDSGVAVVWDMGDGSQLEGETVVYTYDHNGDYLVTVNASNSFGNTVITRFVKVIGGAFYLHMPIILNDGQTTTIIPLASEAELVAETIEFVDNDTEIVLVENPEISDWTPEAQLLWYINEARSQAGLRPVIEVIDLSAAAKAHSDDMAAAQFRGHAGSDGSLPYERIARTRYRQGGYAGEATAWGFQEAISAVEFWLESPPHRAILLNPIADHMGMARTVNYNAPSIWYWTAEFAATAGSIESQMLEAGIRQTKPSIGASYAFTETAILTWSWPLPLMDSENFVVYVIDSQDQETPLGQVRTPINEANPFTYALPVGAVEMGRHAGTYRWLVRLEDIRGDLRTGSTSRSLTLTGPYPTPFPSPTPTTALLLPTAPPLPTALPTTGPPVVQPPAQPTATPLSSESTNPTVVPRPTQSPTVLPSPTATAVPPPTLPPTATPVVLPTIDTGPQPTPSPTAGP